MIIRIGGVEARKTIHFVASNTDEIFILGRIASRVKCFSASPDTNGRGFDLEIEIKELVNLLADTEAK